MIKDYTYIILYKGGGVPKYYSGNKIDVAYYIYQHPERVNTYTYKCPNNLFVELVSKWKNKDTDFFDWIKANKIRKENENKLYKYVYD